jgi:hypothetical protein
LLLKLGMQPEWWLNLENLEGDEKGLTHFVV